MPGLPWTAPENTKLRLLTKTCTTREIAEQMEGRSQKAVIRRMGALGLKARWKYGRAGRKTRLWQPEDDRKLYGLTHLPQKKAAKVLGVPLVAVQHRASKLGIKWRQGRQNPRNLAKRMGIGKHRVYRIVQQTGIGVGRGRKRGGFYDLSDDEVTLLMSHFKEGRLLLRAEKVCENEGSL